MKSPKYSIVLPVKNGEKYLTNCIKSITDQKYEDYELIISDNHSEDNTATFLKDIIDPKIRVIKPPEYLDLSHHWDWAVSHANGEWVILLGVDDGLFPYFFEYADLLTLYANKKNIRVIMSSRAYYFWEGAELLYGNRLVDFYADKSLKIFHSRLHALFVLLGVKQFYELPEMYTSSLFRTDLLCEARRNQSGRVITTFAPDINLAVVACCLEHKYLYSSIPLGWVGTSQGSNAFNLVLKTREDGKLAPLPDFIESSPLAGNLNIASSSLFFWNALLMSKELYSDGMYSFLNNSILKSFIFAGVYWEINKDIKALKRIRIAEFWRILTLNHIPYSLVLFVAYIFFPFFFLVVFFRRVLRKIFRIFKIVTGSEVRMRIDKSDIDNISMLGASVKVSALIKKRRLIEKIKHQIERDLE